MAEVVRVEFGARGQRVRRVKLAPAENQPVESQPACLTQCATPPTPRETPANAETRDEKLARLAKEIRALGVESAIERGQKLIEAKAELSHGEWLPWLREHCDMAERTAQDYMALASWPNARSRADLGIKAAVAEIRAKKKAARLRTPTPDQQIIMLPTHTGGLVPYPAPEGKPTFNITGGHIDWAFFSWDPITGCIHGCIYCYAREIAMARPLLFPAAFDPVFHPERLDAPINTKMPADASHDEFKRRVFVCSMADLFGPWVPREWIRQILAACRARPEYIYLFLTKNPRGYLEWLDEMPPLAWMGASVDEAKLIKFAEQAFAKIPRRFKRWLSLEPLLEFLPFTDLSLFDFAVLGSQTQTIQPEVGIVPAIAPDFWWVASIALDAKQAGCAVHCKSNLLGTVNPHSPGMRLPQDALPSYQEVA